MKFANRDVAIRSALSAIGESQISPSDLIAFVDLSRSELSCVIERAPHAWVIDFAKLTELRELVDALRSGVARDEPKGSAALERVASELTVDSTHWSADSASTL